MVWEKARLRGLEQGISRRRRRAVGRGAVRQIHDRDRLTPRRGVADLALDDHASGRPARLGCSRRRPAAGGDAASCQSSDPKPAGTSAIAAVLQPGLAIGARDGRGACRVPATRSADVTLHAATSLSAVLSTSLIISPLSHSAAVACMRASQRLQDISTRRVWASWRRVTQREASHPTSAPAAAPVYNPTNAPSLPHTPAATAVPVPPPTSTPVQTGCRLAKERRLGGCDWEACVECLVVSSPVSAYRDSAARIGVLCPLRGTPSVVCARAGDAMQTDRARASGARARR